MYDTLEQLETGEIARGYRLEKDHRCHRCLECGAAFREGEVYPIEGRFFEAASAVAHHMAACHPARFGALLWDDSKYNTLTDNQKKLMELFGRGLSDTEIAAETRTAAATVRRQRFMFREKAKQAKLYLALYDLAGLDKKQGAPETLHPVHSGAKLLDDRYIMTQEESSRYVNNAFTSLDPLRLDHLPMKQKKKLAVLSLIAEQFTEGTDYTEKQVNQLLEEIYPDYVTIRRYLIEYGFLDRTPSGSRYWVAKS